MENLDVMSRSNDFLPVTPSVSDSDTISLYDLSEQVGITYEAMRKRLRRFGYSGELSVIPSHIADAVRVSGTSSFARTTVERTITERTITETDDPDAETKNTRLSFCEPVPMSIPAVSVPVADDARPVVFARTWFLYLVYLSALAWQGWHIAAVVAGADSEKVISALNWLSGGLFAFAILFTALLMTIRSGKPVYLIIFAVVDFLFTAFHYKPLRDDATWTNTFMELLIGAGIAFTVYSYSDLFAKLTAKVFKS